MPDNPSNKGLSASQIKSKMYEGYLILFDWMYQERIDIQKVFDSIQTPIQSVVEKLNKNNDTSFKQTLIDALLSGYIKAKAGTTIDLREANLLVSSVIEDTIDQLENYDMTNRDNNYIKVESNRNMDKKVSIEVLLSKKLRTSETIPNDMDVGDYCFLIKEEPKIDVENAIEVEVISESTKELSLYDNNDVQDSFTMTLEENINSEQLYLEETMDYNSLEIDEKEQDISLFEKEDELSLLNKEE